MSPADMAVTRGNGGENVAFKGLFGPSAEGMGVVADPSETACSLLPTMETTVGVALVRVYALLVAPAGVYITTGEASAPPRVKAASSAAMAVNPTETVALNVVFGPSAAVTVMTAVP